MIAMILLEQFIGFNFVWPIDHAIIVKIFSWKKRAMQKAVKRMGSIVCVINLLTGCSYNPFIINNHTTGSAGATAIGAAVGAGSVALLGGSKYLIALGGIGGGAVGYYVTTLRFESGDVLAAGGQVYSIGDFIGIDIPTDNLFEPNTADFLPQAGPILDSAATVLKRRPNNNIIISGNTSGFSRPRWELRLSEERAKKVSAYLWNAGINQFKPSGVDMRKLIYVGYGNFFPIANDYTNEGIRQNSRIQITSYPTNYDLQLDKRHLAIHNIGALDDSSLGPPVSHCDRDSEIKNGKTVCFSGDDP